jgi:predicted XRE-type DNA-binding protein|tara:strand:- start:902 stop:1222 length:321 start_codon:yes stop_codon:yes gene_type:complete
MTLKYDNIFSVGLEDKPEEALELQTRSDLMLVLKNIIADKRWPQKTAGEKLGLTQPQVSDLVNGRIEKFRSDRLLKCLGQLGFVLRPKYEKQTLRVDVVQQTKMPC